MCLSGVSEPGEGGGGGEAAAEILAAVPGAVFNGASGTDIFPVSSNQGEGYAPLASLFDFVSDKIITCKR